VAAAALQLPVDVEHHGRSAVADAGGGEGSEKGQGSTRGKWRVFVRIG
jgi:hypothetical protein